MTRYLVLFLRLEAPGTPRVWEGVEEVKEVDASSAAAAIRQFVESTDAPAGEYVAVPVRSWKPVTVTRVQTTTVRIGAAS